MTECVKCGRPVADAGYLCHDCADVLAKALALTAALARDAEVTITRQDRLGTGGGRPAETPLPYNATAAEAAAEVRAILETWTARIVAARGIASPADRLGQTLAAASALAVQHYGRPGADLLLGRIADIAHRARAAQLAAADQHARLADLALFLAGQVKWIRHQGRPADGGAVPYAEAAYAEIQYAAGRLARICDAHPTLTALGPCMTEGCEGTLRAPHGRSWTRCSECRQVYDVAVRMEQLLAIGADYLFSVRELASILSTWRRRHISTGTVGAWATRHMTDRGRIGASKVYRLGDAVAVAKRLIPETTAKEN